VGSYIFYGDVTVEYLFVLNCYF